MPDPSTGALVRSDRGVLLGGAQLLVSLAAVAGSIQLALGIATPPPSDLGPLGLTSWTLPAVWLFFVVAMPFAIAGVLTLRGSSRALVASLTASGLLVLELVVQIPFVGFNAMQLVMAAVAIVTGLLARRRHLR
jgi:hypothetical protein